MDVVFMGDSHGDWPKSWPKADLAIHVGDFGYWPGYESRWIQRRPSYPVWFIEGNHEHYPLLEMTRKGREGLVEVWPGAFHVPRGHVERLNGIVVGFCGGADSVDTDYRKEYVDWWRDEAVQPVDFKEDKLDILVTHSPPVEVYYKLFGPIPRNPFSRNGMRPAPLGSATAVSEMIKKYSPNLNLSGHLHKSLLHNGSDRLYGTTDLMVLDINQTFSTSTEELSREHVHRKA